MNTLKQRTYVAIMAGGIGSRFWPMSRTAHPKQFLDILGTGRTLLQQTYDRYLPLCNAHRMLVVTNSQYDDLVAAQLPDVPHGNVLLEPARRNTAPCIAYAAFRIAETDPDGLMIVASSDHLILRQREFEASMEKALQAATHEGALVTLGIVPTRPDTGYGYIQHREEDSLGLPGVHRVKTFTEKPDLAMAEQFLASGDFLWNSGMFIWSVRSILEAIERHAPELYNLFAKGRGIYGTPAEADLIKAVYEQCTNISIDYAVMEKAQNVYSIGADIGWSDLGTWGSMYAYSEKDPQGNVIQGRNVMTHEVNDCIINMPKDKLVVVQGLQDMIVVESDGILLICSRHEEQQIKRIVNEVKALKGDRFV
jgi:mannose-1-phosphate guanylyltransferase